MPSKSECTSEMRDSSFVLKVYTALVRKKLWCNRNKSYVLVSLHLQGSDVAFHQRDIVGSLTAGVKQ